MTISELRKEVNRLIAQARTHKALEALENYLSDIQDEDYTNDLIQLQARYNQNERKNRSGIISSDEYGLESRRINAALQGLLETMDEDEDSPPSKPDRTNTPSGSEIRKILFLAANPLQTGQLRLGEEIREIEESLKRSTHRDRFSLNQRHAVRPLDLSRALIEIDPDIVHFSGHGQINKDMGTQGGRSLLFDPTLPEDERFGIVLEDNMGNPKWVSAAALAGLLAQFKNLDCVLLNACYSRIQGEAILKHVPFVIGMKHAIPDKTAIAFATSFYDGLGGGMEIPRAFEIAKAALAFEGLTGSDLPVLLKRE